MYIFQYLNNIKYSKMEPSEEKIHYMLTLITNSSLPYDAK